MMITMTGNAIGVRVATRLRHATIASVTRNRAERVSFFLFRSDIYAREHDNLARFFDRTRLWAIFSYRES